MKKIILPLITVAIITLTGCKTNSGDPKAVLTSFFDALGKKDFTSAKKYTTKDSEGMLSMVQMGMEHMADSSETMKYEKENLELGNAVINGDVATIPVKEKKSGETTDFTLKKESGEWKVAFDKSTLMEMAQKKMKEHGYGGMRGMHDSSKNIDENPMLMDSSSREEMQNAQKMLDSVRKMTDKVKEDGK